MKTVTIATCGLPPHADDPRCACRGADTELFFPKRGDPGVARAAKAICAGCDLRQECLDWALPVTDLAGIFGGTTAVDRKRLRRERADGG